MRRLPKLISISAALILFIVPGTFTAEAQEPLQSFFDSFYKIELTPKDPEPYEPMIAEIVTYSTDINRADISWFVNGKLIKAGVGEKKIRLQGIVFGETAKIEVVVKTVEGGTVTKSLTVKPAGVEIMWYSKSYAPPFYKGKTRLVQEGKLVLIAVPHFPITGGSEISPKNLVYKWKQGNSVLENGFGKNSITIDKVPAYSSPFVIVEVASIDNSMKASISIEVRAGKPEVVLYEESPLYGLLTNASLGNRYDLKSPELNIAAVPYFFTVSNSKDANLTYDWNLGDKSFPEKAHDNKITVKKPEGGGLSNINLSLQHSYDPYQRAETRLVLSY